MANALVSLDQFLSFAEITVHTSSGLVTIMSYLATSVVGYFNLFFSPPTLRNVKILIFVLLTGLLR